MPRGNTAAKVGIIKFLLSLDRQIALPIHSAIFTQSHPPPEVVGAMMCIEVKQEFAKYNGT